MSLFRPIILIKFMLIKFMLIIKAQFKTVASILTDIINLRRH